ncbi:MAG: ribosome biogenesis GTP-binding protein YihA/YsxC [Bacteroidota bacterium]
MIVHSASFVMSNTQVDKCPPPKLPEFAFIGRSNVGKSSLINMLVAQKGLAKTSSKPGKTQTINHFVVNENWYLVDLPGYGFAGVSQTTRAKWSGMIDSYLTKRANLFCTFVLVDVRLTPQAKDMDFIQWMGERQLPFAIVFTKSDKLTRNELNKSLAAWTRQLEARWDELPPRFVTSAETKLGRDELLEFIETAILRER